MIALVIALGALAFFQRDLRHTYQTTAVHETIRNRQWVDALALLDRFPVDDQKTGHWCYLRGCVERRRGNAIAAEQNFILAAELGWSRAEVARQQLLLKAQSGRINEVESELQEIIASGASDAEAEETYEAMSRGYLTTLNLAEANRWLSKWSDWQPTNPIPRLWLGDLSLRLENQEAAAEQYTAVLERDPLHFEGRLNLAKVRLAQLQIEEAARLFDQCISQSPESAEALVGLAECKRRLGIVDQARSLLHQALVLDLAPEQQATALAALGQMALEDRDYTRAVHLLERAVSINPHDPASRMSLAAGLASLGHAQRASKEREVARSIIERHARLIGVTRQATIEPQNADLRCQAALILMEQGLPAVAADWLRMAIRIDPNHAKAHGALASYYEQAGDLEKARRHAELARRHEASDTKPTGDG